MCCWFQSQLNVYSNCMYYFQIYVPTNPRGAESLPPGIVVAESDFYLRRLWGEPSEVRFEGCGNFNIYGACNSFPLDLYAYCLFLNKLEYDCIFALLVVCTLLQHLVFSDILTLVGCNFRLEMVAFTGHLFP